MDAALVVLRVDTPGGLDTSMRAMIRDILASPVPVAAYVGPGGARAASAGTFILYASHVAAMAPGTNLGAATPVAIGGGGLPVPGAEDKKKEPEKAGDKPLRPADPMMAKVTNDAIAYIRSLADLRGRNADWAEQAVREASSLSAKDALERNVIDIVAKSPTDLLAQAHGRTVAVGESSATLDTAGLVLRSFDPDLRTKFLAAITSPSVALILMLVGVYGLIFEFMSPGAVLPGTLGAIALLVGLYGLAALPTNQAGVGLIVLGIVLLVAEAFKPSFGVLGIGGAISFMIGAAILFDPDIPGIEVSRGAVYATGAMSLAFVLLIVRLATLGRRRKVVSGPEQMIGAPARVQEWSGDAGHVIANGERWRAVAAAPLAPGQRVRVVALDGLTLKIQPDDAKTS
jgi:membrane-bound serine protease (ClpP class)